MLSARGAEEDASRMQDGGVQAPSSIFIAKKNMRGSGFLFLLLRVK
jgi:hypothetical protein